jgi:D-alanine-D-alanine ligase
MTTPIILFGGASDERHVSVASAQNLARLLPKALFWFWAPEGAVHDVAMREVVAHQNPFTEDYLPSRPAIFPDIEQALDTLPVEDPVFVLALHGYGSEDGPLQRMFEERDIAFTGSGSAASEAAFDKGRAKEIVRGRVRTAESRVARNGNEIDPIARELIAKYPKIVLKPLAGGSSRGLFFLDRDGDVDEVIAQAGSRGVPYIIEQFISGREITCGVADMGSGAHALPVVEIETDPGFSFDYAGKYLGKGTREVCPANIPDGMRDEAQRIARDAHVALGCEGYSRSDMVGADDGVYYLETNTLPGLTTSSLIPQELRAAGIDMRAFLDRMIELAVARATTTAPRSTPAR